MATLRIVSTPKQPKSFQFVKVKAAQKGAELRKSSQKTGKKVLFTVLGIIFGLFVLTGIIGTVVIAGYIGTINASLPDAGKLATQDMAQSTRIYDRNGNLLYVYGDINREFVSLSKISEKTRWALLAAEDINFYEHRGVDLKGVASALRDYVITGGQSTRGASTITQQLSRNTVLVKILGKDAYSRDITRKVKEMLVTFQLENKLTKDQILELYMNEVPLGGMVYGYQTASKAYFNKDVSQLSLSESALLAVIIRYPSGYSQDILNGETEDVLKYRNIVLDNMLKYKDKTGVTEEEIKTAKDEKIAINPGKVDLIAPHFVFYVLNILEQQYGADMVKTGGLRVYTTLDLETQKIAEEEVRNNIAYSRGQYGVANAAVVILNPKNGETLAMVGSVDYNNTTDPKVDGNVNVAVMPRQMGSSVKPYTYLEAFHRGYNPGSLAPDIKMTFGAYAPENWNFQYDGLLTMRRALNQSRNLTAVYTLQLIGGTDVFLQAAKNLGITTLTQTDQYGLSLTLGAGDMRLIEHTNAFGVFANKGVRHDISTIMRVTDPNGKELFKSDPAKSEKRVYSEEEIYLLNWVMCMMPPGDQDKHVPGLYRAAGQNLCGKTGTTNGPKDLLTLLYYPRLVVGVWAGNNDGTITFGRQQGWSENVPIIIANNIMKRIIPKYGTEWYTQPANIAFTTTCIDTGLGWAEGVDCPKFTTPIIKGKGPATDTAHKKLPICTKTGKIASNEAEARAAGLVTDKLFLDFVLPNTAQQGAYDNYVKTKMGYNLWKEKPEAAECIPDVAVTFTVPAANANVNPGQSITVRVTATSTKPVDTVTFTIGTTTYTSTVNATGTIFTCVGCKIPTTATAGQLTIKASAVDTEKGTGNATITVNVVIAPSPTPSPSPSPSPSPKPSVIVTPSPSPKPS